MSVRSCARCLAAVRWVKTGTGELLMVDEDTHEDGTIEVDGHLALIHDQPDLFGAPRHRLHRDSCTQRPPSRPEAPQAPYVAGSATSKAAAEQLDGKQTEKDRRRILDYLEANGPRTDEQIAADLGINPNSARPRRLELAEQGLIYQYGHAVTAAGRKARTWAIKIQEQLPA